jgi:NAD(P)-dependent dehydrogenase (short-subunit alcohol dehydrogenase family)
MTGIAVVTGAAGGIGAAICRTLAEAGYAVGCLDFDEAGAAAVATELQEAAQKAGEIGVRAVGVGVNIRKAESVRAAADAVRGALGDPGLLVNAAGVFSIQRLPDLAEDEWDRLIDTNLKGPFLTCREFLPAMIAAHEGCIVNIASTAGVRGGRERAAYCASKGGLVQLTRSLAIDHGPDGVRVMCLCPGLIDTPMADWIRHDEERLDRWASGLPAQRMGTPEEIAEVVAFAASPAARYMQGAVLMVDGGGTA